MTYYNINEIIPGTTFSFVSGIDYNLSGSSNHITSIIKEKYSSSTGILSFTEAIIDSGASNTFQISLTPGQTSGLVAGIYVYEVIFVSGNDRFALMNGYLPVGPFTAF